MERFFGSRIECVLNSAKYPAFERALSASMVHGFRFFFLDFGLAKQKICGTAIVYHAQYFYGQVFQTLFIGIL